MVLICLHWQNHALVVIQQLQFDSSSWVESQGRSGGIWLLWNKSRVGIQILSSTQHFIHALVEDDGRPPWLCTVVYINPNAQLKRSGFEEIRNLAGTITLPWLIVGDFNDILAGSEKIGGRPVDMRRCNGFSNWIQNCGLIDFGSVGPKFTWRGPEIGGYGRVFERLDRCLGNHLFRVKFPELIIKVLPRIKSDHHPILVQTHNRGLLYRGAEKPFRFELSSLDVPWSIC